MLYNAEGKSVECQKHFSNERAREHFLAPLREKLEVGHTHHKMFWLQERATFKEKK